MALERNGDDFVLRATGLGRYFAAAFLGFWLCGWAAGEVVAVGALGWGGWHLVTHPEALTGGPEVLLPYVAGGLFLALWLSLWTFGGITALRQFTRSLWGADTLRVNYQGLQLRSRGLGVTTRTIDRDVIGHVLVRHRTGALIAEVAGKDVLLTDLGTLDDRKALQEEIQRRLALSKNTVSTALPNTWELRTELDGTVVLTPEPTIRRTQTRVMAAIAIAIDLPVAWFVVRCVAEPTQGPVWIVAGILLAFAALATYGWLWLARGLDEWRFRRDGVDRVRGLPWRLKRIQFSRGTLNLHVSRDSDGDDWFELQLDADGKRTKIANAMNDPRDPVRLGRAIERASGWTFHVPAHLDV